MDRLRNCLNNNYFVFSIISLLAVVYNMLTMSNALPWIDEVMFTDVPANVALHGEWETTAWYGGECTYMPLYQFLLVGWIKLFGFSLLSCRSLNLLLMYLVGLVSIKLMHKFLGGGKSKLSILAVVIFGLLFWFSAEMATIYRNGRVDVLGMLCASVVAWTVIDYIEGKSGKYTDRVFLASVLLFLSGVQAGIFAGALFVLALVLYPALRRRLAISLFSFVLGGAVSGILTSVFMYFFVNVKSFIMSFVGYSATLGRIFVVVRPLLSPILGESNIVLDNLNSGPTFIERLSEAFLSVHFGLLSLLMIILVLVNIKDKSSLSKNNVLLIFCLVSLYVPIVMTFAGRFAGYYRWMCYLPMIYAITLSACLYNGRKTKAIAILGSLMLVCGGIKTFGSPSDYTYSKISSFIHKQPFEKNDKIVATFPTFYEVKTICDNCYFLEFYAVEDTPVADYIIVPTEKGKTEGRYYREAKGIEDYIERIKADSTKQMILIDELDYPSMRVYGVKDK